MLLGLAAFVGWHLYLRQMRAGQLAAAVARTNQLDPGWTLEEIESSRATIPDEENGARRVLAARKLLPERWPPRDFGEDWDEIAAPVRRRDDQAAALRAALADVGPALEEARRLDHLPRGRYPITYADDFLGTLVPHNDAVRTVAYLLRADAMARVEEGDLDGALRSCQAIVNCGRSVGDEPLLITALVRLAARQHALRGLSRALAHGEPSEDALVAVQRALDEEAGQNLLPQALRGERAGVHRLWSNVEAGQIALESLDGKVHPPHGWEKVSNLWVIPRVMEAHTQSLDTLNEAIEVAGLPPEEHPAFFEELRDKRRQLAPLVGLFVYGYGTVALAHARSVAETRAAVAALAAERARRRHGRWPLALSALVPDLLPAVPLDPFTNLPLRLRRLPDGLIIYSVGEDRRDNDGKLPEPGEKPGRNNDIGFRLWDVGKRRQPPEAAKEPSERRP